MLCLCYDLIIFFGALIQLPRWVIKKKYRGSLKQRLGISLPPSTPSEKPGIWIHMVSMGETRVMISIYKALRKKYPDTPFYLSSTTKTGHQEAQKSLPGAQGYFYLPPDLSWFMKRLTRTIKPQLLILSESDFWFQMIKSVKERGGKVALLNGKISATSQKRFSHFPWFAKQLFEQIDLFCLQSIEQEKRFSQLLVPKAKITVTSNLKLATPLQPLTKKEQITFRAKLKLSPEERVITIGSTHRVEEALIIDQVKKIPGIKFLLVPRHPERFQAVRDWLMKVGNDQIILVDQMGILTQCYQISELAIVGGSFIPGVGGHNIFEPIRHAKIPAVFGPYMEQQRELTEIVLQGKAGLQISYEQIKETIDHFLQNPEPLKERAEKLSSIGEKVHQTTWTALEKMEFPCI